MMNMSMLQKTPAIFFPVLVLLLLASPCFVCGFGVSPGRKVVDFEPGKDVELEFNVVNSEQADLKASISISGELSDILFSEQDMLDIKQDVSRVPFKVMLRFPNEMEPGVHTGVIKATPVIESAGNRMFMAYVSPKIIVSVRVPYPAKYLEVSLRTLDVDEGTPVPLYITLDNLGSEDIAQAWARAEIYDIHGEFIQSAETRKVSIQSNDVRELQAVPGPILRKGVYPAAVNAYYDGETKLFETNFSLGEPRIRIKELITQKLAKDEINKMVFMVYNDWNTGLSARGFLEIGSRQNEIPVFEIDAHEEKEITGFFDTTGIETGEYNLSVTLIYEGQTRTEPFYVQILEKELIEEEKPEIPAPLVVTGGLFIIMIIALLVVFIIKKRKKSKPKAMEMDAERFAEREAEKDIKRNIERDAEKDIKRNIERDAEKDIKRDIERDAEKDMKRNIERDKKRNINGAKSTGMTNNKITDNKNSKSENETFK
jgi:hypothetical protein